MRKFIFHLRKKNAVKAIIGYCLFHFSSVPKTHHGPRYGNKPHQRQQTPTNTTIHLDGIPQLPILSSLSALYFDHKQFPLIFACELRKHPYSLSRCNLKWRFGINITIMHRQISASDVYRWHRLKWTLNMNMVWSLDKRDNESIAIGKMQRCETS